MLNLPKTVTIKGKIAQVIGYNYTTKCLICVIGSLTDDNSELLEVAA